MFDSFYDIKPLEEWLNLDNGLVYHNSTAIASLNVIPATFGHIIVFPTRVVNRATDLEPDELWHLFYAEECAREKIMNLNEAGRVHIKNLYERWMVDEKLNRQLNGRPKEMIPHAIKDMELELLGFTPFINIGEDVGQTVRQYHLQVAPRYKKGGGGQIISQHEHELF